VLAAANGGSSRIASTVCARKISQTRSKRMEREAGGDEARGCKRRRRRQRRRRRSSAPRKRPGRSGEGRKTKPEYRELPMGFRSGATGRCAYEASDLAEQKNSFVFRRFVLTRIANIARAAQLLRARVRAFSQTGIGEDDAAQGNGVFNQQP